ncbi:FHA domain-containing protein [Aurantimicrobium minutum]|uniref:FHA domain-containing protein n=1 Tax=Aurantimicrobium minutum TaxID=708131 RepID=UPI0024745E36|nr:FHA domain-containing protein [Aurantimicrobium minutum]MDH6422269.1 hypothetical protein [Aurantimicrobium minutum]
MSNELMPRSSKKSVKASEKATGRFFKQVTQREHTRQVSDDAVAKPVGDAASVAMSAVVSGVMSGHDSDNRTDMADTLEIPVRTADATGATRDATTTLMARHDSDSNDKPGDRSATGHGDIGHDIGHDIGDVSGQGSDKSRSRGVSGATAKDAVRTETLHHVAGGGVSVVDDRTVVPSSSWMLVVAGKEYVLPGARVVVGRRPSADDGSLTLRIDDPTRTISRVHALLTNEGDDWFVEDLHSGNGVSVITVRGGERKIVPGDRVLASEEMMFGDQLVELKRLSF